MREWLVEVLTSWLLCLQFQISPFPKYNECYWPHERSECSHKYKKSFFSCENQGVRLSWHGWNKTWINSLEVVSGVRGDHENLWPQEFTAALRKEGTGLGVELNLSVGKAQSDPGSFLGSMCSKHSLWLAQPPCPLWKLIHSVGRGLVPATHSIIC